LLEAVKEKGFDLSDEAKQNFTSITYDHGSNMKGPKIGLIILLKKEFPDRYIFGMEDPCHPLALALKYTVKELPDQITDFIDT